MHKLTDSILDKFSMDFLRNQVLKMLMAMMIPLLQDLIPGCF